MLRKKKKQEKKLSIVCKKGMGNTGIFNIGINYTFCPAEKKKMGNVIQIIHLLS